MVTNLTKVSFFKKPITNKRPLRTVNLFQVYQVVRGGYYEAVTKQLRSINNKVEQRRFKSKNLDYITPSGTFSYGDDKSLITHSGILCMDLDDLKEVESLKQKLISDENFETLLIFRSPSGDGLKWFIAIDIDKYDHKTWFEAVRNYLMASYNLTDKQVDKSCSNVSKACFLCYDPEAYINQELKVTFKTKYNE